MKSSMTLKFSELRKYISEIDKISICMSENLQYNNYRYMKDVPHKYDEYFVYGIGVIESEFPVEEELDRNETRICDVKYIFTTCLEIMLSETPRDLYTQ